MNTIDRGRAEARSRASRRLRNMTIGTTILGIAATGGLGWVAAATDDGPTIASTAAVVTTADGATGTSSSPSTTSGTSSTATSVPTVSAASGSAHASTGGS